MDPPFLTPVQRPHLPPRSPSTTTAPVSIPALGFTTDAAFKNHQQPLTRDLSRNHSMNMSTSSIATATESVVSSEDCSSAMASLSSSPTSSGRPSIAVQPPAPEKRDLNRMAAGGLASIPPAFAPLPPTAHPHPSSAASSMNFINNHRRNVHPTPESIGSSLASDDSDPRLSAHHRGRSESSIQMPSASMPSPDHMIHRHGHKGPGYKKNLHVNVRRKGSCVDVTTPMSYSSVSPSPAMSFLSSLADISTASKPPEEFTLRVTKSVIGSLVAKLATAPSPASSKPPLPRLQLYAQKGRH
ncbi:hypothetical protein BC829DRAFT_74797 [Chytridium lagenaria]|nr:hypothetical protein BC829DRAFT_74797 [Chytridium lagenaria]